jgi:hypothetical protein
MKRAHELQAELSAALKEIRVEATAGGGMVQVVADGEQNIIEIRIQPEILNPADAAMLSELIRAAVNEARRRASEEARRKIQGILGVPLPGIF